MTCSQLLIGQLSFGDLTKHLACLTQLKHLNLELGVSQEVANGNQWEKFLTKYLPGLSKFQFKFQFHMTELFGLTNDIIESFRSTFWLEEKRWFVVLTELKQHSYWGEFI